jgi:YfiH family protein
MNPADHVGDEPAAVQANRQRLQQVLGLPGQPLWLQQVHGTAVVNAAGAGQSPRADGSYSRQPGTVCAVMTADCLPLLLTDSAGQCVAAVHAGWRGLAAGVIEQAVTAMGQPGDSLLAWLGPAIGPAAFRVGDEVRAAFVAHDSAAAAAFRSGPDDSWFADLYQLARQRLADSGVAAVYGGGYCSFSEPEQLFSYRRDGATGRMATLIWLEE